MPYENINWGAPAAAQRADQAQFADMLGKAINNYQLGQDRDLKRRQLEVKANSDYEQRAQNAVYQDALSKGMTPEQATIAVMQVSKQGSMYPDPISKELVYKPSGWERVNLGGGATQPMEASQQGPQFADMGGGALVPPVDTVPMGGQEIPRLDVSQLGSGNPPYNQPHDYVSDDTGYKAQGILKDTRAGKLMEEESRQKLVEAHAAEKMKRKIKGLERYNAQQLSSANFANRMVETSNIIDSLEDGSDQAKTGIAGYTESIISAIPSGGITDKIGKGVVKLAASPEQQKYLNAAQNWIQRLTKESGAVIGEQEMIDEYSTYFPTAADSKELMAQKKELRKQTEMGMIMQSAGSYQEAFGKKAEAIKEQSKPNVQDLINKYKN